MNDQDTPVEVKNTDIYPCARVFSPFGLLKQQQKYPGQGTEQWMASVRQGVAKVLPLTSGSSSRRITSTSGSSGIGSP
jgi:hypothetical protein